MGKCNCKEKMFNIAARTAMFLLIVMTVCYTYLSLDNFHNGFDDRPVRPNVTYVNETKEDYYNGGFYNSERLSNNYTHYLDEWSAYSKYVNKAMSYTIIPSSVIAILMLSLFLNSSSSVVTMLQSTTAFMYTIWSCIITAVSMTIYLNLPGYFYSSPNYRNVSTMWTYVIVMLSTMLSGGIFMNFFTICSLTVKSWCLPTFSKLLNIDRFLDACRLTCCVFLVALLINYYAFFPYGMIDLDCTLKQELCHKVAYPWVFGYLIFCSVITSTISCSSSAIAGLIGTPHRGVETVLLFFLSTMLGVSSVVTSNYFLINVLHMRFKYNDMTLVVYLNILLGLTLLQFLLKLIVPNFITKSLGIIERIDKFFVSTVQSTDLNQAQQGLTSMFAPIRRTPKVKYSLLIIFSVSSLCIGVSFHSCDFWRAVCIATNAVTAVAALSSLAECLSTEHTQDNKKDMVYTAIEILLVFVAGVAMTFDAWDGLGKFAGVLTFCCFIIHVGTWPYSNNWRQHIRTILPKNDQQQVLTENEETPEDNGEEQTSNPQALKEDATVVNVSNIHDVM